MNRGNPLVQALSLIVAAALLGLAFVIGAVVIGVLLALGAVAALTLAIRIWWLRRRALSAAAGDTAERSTRHVIEGDYTVVGENDTNPGHPKSVSRDDARSRPRDPAD
jgi:uncharacterized iron-regulated membrane protein